MASQALVRRALLYVPASSQKMLEKSRGIQVDCIVYDLEDSVAEDRKADARLDLRKFLDGPRPQGAKEIAVRINGVDTVHALADLVEVLPSKHIDALVIPKTQQASDLEFVTTVLRQTLPERHGTGDSIPGNHQPPIRLLPLIESAKGLVNLQEVCQASPYLSGLVFAAEDFTLDLGITRTQDLPELLYARSQIVATAHAFGVQSIIDLVCTSYKGNEGHEALKNETLAGKNLGFNGKQCIHPAQVEIVQDIFAPSRKDLEWAVKVTVASEKAKKQGRGAWSLDGQVVDVPIIRRAKAVLEKARSCEIDARELEKDFADQEPE